MTVPEQVAEDWFKEGWDEDEARLPVFRPASAEAVDAELCELRSREGDNRLRMAAVLTAASDARFYGAGSLERTCAENQIEYSTGKSMVAGYQRLRGLEIVDRSTIVAAIRSGELYWSKLEIAASVKDDAEYSGLLNEAADGNVTNSEMRKRVKKLTGKVQEGFEPKLYTIWNFASSTNEVKHPGNIPPEVLENLLYYYTEAGDLVFDPFAGGGMTIDVCEKHGRRYYVSDLNPIEKRPIRQWDITRGFPENLPVADLVFLDPPYWRQAQGKYSNQATDLSNIELDQFVSTIGDIAERSRSMWASDESRERGYLAIIIGPYQRKWRKIDLGLLLYDRIKGCLPLKERIIVPYSTQVHGGKFVNMAKERRELLYLHRDLMVFEYRNGGIK